MTRISVQFLVIFFLLLTGTVRADSQGTWTTVYQNNSGARFSSMAALCANNAIPYSAFIDDDELHFWYSDITCALAPDDPVPDVLPPNLYGYSVLLYYKDHHYWKHSYPLQDIVGGGNVAAGYEVHVYCPAGHDFDPSELDTGHVTCGGTAILKLNAAMQNNRALPDDQFMVSISSFSDPISGLTTGSGSTVTPGTGVNRQVLNSSATYSIGEKLAGSSNSKNYTFSLNCTNSGSGGTVLPHGSGRSFSITPRLGDVITCTFTNTAIPTPPPVPPPSGPLGANENQDGSDLTGTTTCHCNDPLPGGAKGAAVSEPVNAATGNKYMTVTDTVGRGSFPLNVTRYYNSKAMDTAGSFGNQWRSFYDRSVVFGSNMATVYRPDGKTFYFNSSGGGTWTAAQLNVNGVLASGTDWFEYTTPDHTIEHYDGAGVLLWITNAQGIQQVMTYDASGTLSQVTDNFGHSLLFTNDGNGLITSVTDLKGGAWVYGYDASGNLITVTGPDGKVLTYLYEGLPGLLTGVIDENGVRTGTTTYDDAGRATSTVEAGPQGGVTINYSSDGSSALVTDARGIPATYGFTPVNGAPQFTAKTLTNGATASATYDSHGNVTSQTDLNGHVTTYIYNSRNLETSRTEAAGTPQARIITTTWSADFRLPTTITEPGRVTTYTYDGSGNLFSTLITDTASSNNQFWYNIWGPYGQLFNAFSPGGNPNQSTSYTYDGQNNLTSITNRLGHVTQFSSFNGNGYPQVIVDPNGLTTSLTYDARDRLLSQSSGGETTSYQYDGVGQLIQVTLPSGSSVSYVYDTAHRLTEIHDQAGDKIIYTLDAMGHHLSESIIGNNGLGSLLKHIEQGLAHARLFATR